MKKLCFSCWKKIPIMAGRCPYCLSNDQMVHGRLIFLFLLIVGVIAFGYYYSKDDTDSTQNKKVEKVYEPK